MHREFFENKWNMLGSFYYMTPDEPVWINSAANNGYMLDSGAFTFIEQSAKSLKGGTNLEDYIQRYCDFINQHKIDLFFEFDIDAVSTLRQVEKYRDFIEHQTGKQCIPVWHKSRGQQYFVDMCKDYPYVAIGGIVSGEIKRSQFGVFPWFINTAHHHGAKIHGLGLTSAKVVTKYPFDSVDSKAWLGGSYAGYVYQFTGTGIVSSKNTRNFKVRYRDLDNHNFSEWVKFANYMEGRPCIA